MTTLTPSSFTQAEQDAINFRLNVIDRDIAQLTAQNADPNTKFNAVTIFDDANQKVQDASIAQLITILHGVITARDLSEPGDVPHSIRFNPVSAGDPSFPVTAPELFASTNLTTYLAALPLYAIPFDDASLDNGTTAPATITGGWQMWQEETPGPGREPDPSQPTVGELTAAFPVLVQEFNERNGERLDSSIGSYVHRNLITLQNNSNSNALALLLQRKAFWEGIGFPTA